MAIEQLFEALPLHYLQHGISRFGAANIVLAVFVTAALGVLADYAWMLYLRSKMVRIGILFTCLETYLTFCSLQDLSHILSLATRFSFQTTSPGYTSRNSRRGTTHP
jgi:hypothetical protein